LARAKEPEKTNVEAQSSLRYAEKRLRRRGILEFRTSLYKDGNAAECRGIAANPQALDARKSGVKLLALR
jgi:hypothetical protein